MRLRRIFSAGLLVLATAVLAVPSPVSAFAGGAGSSANPYQIATCSQLFAIDDSTANLASHYVFINDVDCSVGSESPMSTSSPFFSGTLNGANYSLLGLDITCTSGWGCALFQGVSGSASISNLTVVSPLINSSGVASGGSPANAHTGVLVGQSGSTSNPSFSGITIAGGTIDAGVRKATGGPSAGSIAGQIYRGTISNSTSSATVTGSVYVGGLAGMLGDQNTTCSAGSPSLSGSTFTGSVSGSQYVGGLIGEFGPNRGKDLCEITNSSNSGTVTGTVGGTATTCSIIGGVVGQLWEATVEDSHNSGVVNGGTNSCDDVGGIVGWARGNSLSNSSIESPRILKAFSTGAVSAEHRVGGIAGTCDRGDLTLSYSTGTVTSSGTYSGGISGWTSCLTSDTYSRANVSGVTYSAGFAGGIDFYGISKSYSTSTSRGFVGFRSSGSCTNSFWDTTIGAANSTPCGPTGKTTGEMKTQSTFTGASWDFTSGTGIWSIDPAINDGYPYLANVGGQALAAPTVVLSAVSSTSTTRNIQFRLTATTGQINCSTVSAVDGVDFDLTNIVSITIAQTNPTVCTISAVSTISADGATGTSSLAEASTFSVSYSGSANQTNISSGAPASVTVSIPAAATTTTVAATTTTVASVTTTTNAPSSGASATTTTTAGSPATTVAPSNTAAPAGVSGGVTTTVPARDDDGADATDGSVTPAASATTTTSTIPAAPVSTLPPLDVPPVSDGGGALTIGGRRVEATVTRENNQLILEAGPIVARISALKREGGRAPLDADGRIRMMAGDSVEVEVTGFGPSTEVEVRLYSEPTLLGRSGVNDEGQLLASYEIPEAVSDGDHTVVLAGESREAEELVFALSVAIGEQNEGPSLFTIFVLIPLGLAAAGALIIPAVLRRRRREQPA